MNSFKLFWIPLPFVDSGNDQFTCTRREKTWLCYLRTAKVQGRIRICAVWSLPLFFAISKCAKQHVQRMRRLVMVFTVRAHYWITFISRAMIRLQKLRRQIYASACKNSDFLATVIKFIMKCRAWSRSTLFAIQAVTPHGLVRIAYRRVIIILF